MIFSQKGREMTKEYKLNLLRKFDSEIERREYFTFPNRDSVGSSSTYTMTNEQMREREIAIVKRIVRNVFHYIKIIIRK